MPPPRGNQGGDREVPFPTAWHISVAPGFLFGVISRGDSRGGTDRGLQPPAALAGRESRIGLSASETHRAASTRDRAQAEGLAGGRKTGPASRSDARGERDGAEFEVAVRRGVGRQWIIDSFLEKSGTPGNHDRYWVLGRSRLIAPHGHEGATGLTRQNRGEMWPK